MCTYIVMKEVYQFYLFLKNKYQFWLHFSPDLKCMYVMYYLRMLYQREEGQVGQEDEGETAAGRQTGSQGPQTGHHNI